MKNAQTADDLAENLAEDATCSQTSGDNFEDLYYDLLHKSMRKALLRRGMLFLLFGVLIFFQPVTSIAVAVMVLGFYAVIEGVTSFMQLRKLPNGTRLVPLVNSVILLLLGAGAIIFPWQMGEYVIIFFGVWQIISGIQCLFLLKLPHQRVRTLLTGLFAIVSGVFFIAAPLLGLLAASWLFALLFAVSGVMMIVTALAIREAAE